MNLIPLYNPERGIMKVAGFMSGSGSNLKKIIEHGMNTTNKGGEHLYQVTLIFTDNTNSNAELIGREYGVPVVVKDLAEFCRIKGRNKRDLEVRKEFDSETVGILRDHDIDTIAYAGYMSIVTEPLIDCFFGVNVHPADLSLMDGEKRRYTGANVIRDAILAGEKEIRSTTHLVEKRVDYGEILMISAPVPVVLPDDFDSTNKIQVNSLVNEHQHRLKQLGDWEIMPKTLEYIAGNRYSYDGENNLHFDGEPIPQGVRLE